MDSLPERVPPQNLEAEQSVLGAMLIEGEAIVRAAEILRPEDFYRDAHRRVFEAIIALSDRSEAVDLVTVTEELRRRGQLEEVGGASYLTTLANIVPTAANVEHYARIVEEKALLRNLISAATRVVTRAYEAQDEVAALVDEAEQVIFEISQRRSLAGYAHIKDILMDTFERIEYLYAHKGGVTGVPTGFKDLDELTSGLQPSDLVILAARPSQGKTTLSLGMARNAAVNHKIPVGIFSLEMGREALAQRLLCSEAGVDGQRLRTGYLAEQDWPRLSHALGRLSEAPIFIDDTPAISIMELRARARRMRAEHGIGFLIVDYLQLVQFRGRVENRQQEVAEISRALKALARELKLPVLACSQLSRAVEQREGRRPQLSDLRESGSLEQDSDVVMFIHFNPDSEHKNLAEIIVAKQRNGPTGSVDLVFLREFGKFQSVERRHKTA